MSEKISECKACKQQIAKSAKVCPHCGAKIRRANPFLIGAIVFIAFVVIIAASGGDDEPVLVDNGSNQTSTMTTDAKNEKNTFSVGEIAELKDIQVSLVGVSESTGSQFNKPTEGNVFVICEFEIANNSDEEIIISSMLSFEAYCDDYTCAYSLNALMEKGGKNQLDGTVAASKKFNGVIGYEVPADWQELELHFTPDFWSGKEIVFVANND